MQTLTMLGPALCFVLIPICAHDVTASIALLILAMLCFGFFTGIYSGNPDEHRDHVLRSLQAETFRLRLTWRLTSVAHCLEYARSERMLCYL